MFKSIVFAMACIALSGRQAHAYIDFGTGSYVVQILAASAIGGLFLIKTYLRRIKQFFSRKPLAGEAVADDTQGPQ